MNSQQRKLSAIVSIIFTLVLVLEFTNHQGMHMGVIADQHASKLLLTRANDTIIINLEDWLVAVNSYTNEVVGRGRLNSFTPADSAGAIVLNLVDKKESFNVHSNSYNTLWIGHAREVGRRTGKSFLAGAGLGAAVALGMAVAEGGSDYLFITLPLCAGIDGVTLGVLGALSGAVAHGYADEYPLGSDMWSLSITNGNAGVQTPPVDSQP